MPERAYFARSATHVPNRVSVRDRITALFAKIRRRYYYTDGRKLTTRKITKHVPALTFEIRRGRAVLDLPIIRLRDTAAADARTRGANEHTRAAERELKPRTETTTDTERRDGMEHKKKKNKAILKRRRARAHESRRHSSRHPFCDGYGAANVRYPRKLRARSVAAHMRCKGRRDVTSSPPLLISTTGSPTGHRPP